MLRQLGADVVPYALADHANYSEALVRKIIEKAETEHVAIIVTTSKDTVKSRKYFERAGVAIPVFVLRQQIEFLEGEERFYSAIDSIL